MSPDVLLGKLTRAIRRKNPKHLEKIINECVASGFPELEEDIQEAREVLQGLLEDREGSIIYLFGFIFWSFIE